MALVVMAAGMAMAVVTIITRVAVAMRVPREMNVQPIGMARNVGMGGACVRHRGSAEQQLEEHAEHEQPSHEKPSLVRSSRHAKCSVQDGYCRRRQAAAGGVVGAETLDDKPLAARWQPME